MWDRVLDILTDKMVIVCTVLVFVVPLSINFINTKMHEAGDPPWKKDE